MENESIINESTINDLNVNQTIEAEIKGGPKRIFIGGLSATQSALADLEPEGEVVGGALKGKPMHLVHTGGSTLNHNETTVEDDEAEIETLTDLEVITADQIAGGLLKRIRIGGMS